MKPKKPTLTELAELCAQLGPEDGIDPVTLAKQHNKCNQGRTAKDRQLCKQVERTLHLEFAGVCDDPILQAIHVSSVEPAPDAQHLCVTVVACDSEAAPDSETVSATLARAASRLRAVVAASIHRRRAPALSFRYLPPDTDREEER